MQTHGQRTSGGNKGQWEESNDIKLLYMQFKQSTQSSLGIDQILLYIYIYKRSSPSETEVKAHFPSVL